MSTPRLCSAAGMLIIAACIFGFGSAYREVQRHEQLSAQLMQWELEEWKQLLVEERRREFLGQ